MVKEFLYNSHNETKRRRVFVIREDSTHIEGIDLTLLSNEDAKFIEDHYKDFIPIADKSIKVTLEDFNPSWNKAYRHFIKSRICT